ncbi:unnamed protein product [Mucor fragilis]
MITLCKIREETQFHEGHSHALWKTTIHTNKHYQENKGKISSDRCCWKQSSSCNWASALFVFLYKYLRLFDSLFPLLPHLYFLLLLLLSIMPATASLSHLVIASRRIFSNFNRKYLTHQPQKKKLRKRPSISSFNSTRSTLHKVHPVPAIQRSNSIMSHKQQQRPTTEELFQLAQQHLYGRNGKSKDESRATSYLKEAANNNHSGAQAVLGFCYEFGLGISLDFQLAERYYIMSVKTALTENNATHSIDELELDQATLLGMARLAFLRKYGRPGVQINRVEAEYWEAKIQSRGPDAIAWIRRAAELDRCPASQYCLGVCYHDGIAVPKDEHKAFRWYKKSADQGNCRGQGILGYCYGEGFGVEKSEQTAMEYYRLAAAQDETVAVYNIGYCYEDGIGVAKDHVEAVKYYRLAAEQGNAFAQNSLGYCYEDGIGVPQDKTIAANWYRQSAEQGYPWAQCNLGYCHQNGIGAEKDTVKGAYWYGQAARQGHARAQHNLGFCYQNGIGVTRNLQMAVAWYKKSANQGNIFAYHSLGYCFQNGLGVEVNLRESCYWYFRSAEHNHAPAQLSLGFCFRNGMGVEKNEEEACKWFRLSALQGNPLAQNSLGFCYEEGLGVKKDPKFACYWYMKAAKQNNPWAQCNLGFCYASGIGVPENPQKAIYWYRKAAQQNHARAQDKLGVHLQAGVGCRQNLEMAVHYFRLSAQQDQVAAQYHLALCYEKGLGTPVNLEEALKWFERAATAGCRNSYQRLRQLLLRYCLENASAAEIIQRVDNATGCWSNSADSHPLGWVSGFAAPAA